MMLENVIQFENQWTSGSAAQRILLDCIPSLPKEAMSSWTQQDALL
jgi:hypothetical protein